MPLNHNLRHSAGDNDRSRLLKEVLRSSDDHLSSSQALLNERLGKAALQMSPKAKKTAKSKVSHSPLDADLSQTLEELLAAERDIQGPIAEHFATMGLSRTLRGCGERISGLRTRSEKADTKFETEYPTGRHPTAEEVEGISFAPELPGDEAAIAERRRADRATMDYLRQNIHFDQLDQLEKKIEAADGYEGLRGEFARKSKKCGHPCLILLSDKAMKDPALWAEAMPKDPVELGTLDVVSQENYKLWAALLEGDNHEERRKATKLERSGRRRSSNLGDSYTTRANSTTALSSTAGARRESKG